jgi:hypothetical protein
VFFRHAGGDPAVQSLLRILNFFVLLRGVADLAQTAASGGNAQLRQKPLRQHEPSHDKQRQSKPLIHKHS